MDRPKMTLKNEIVNHFHHLLADIPGTKGIASQVKFAIQQLSVFDFTRGRLATLEEHPTEENKKEIEELQLYVKTEEEKLRTYYRVEEIKGT